MSQLLTNLELIVRRALHNHWSNAGEHRHREHSERENVRRSGQWLAQSLLRRAIADSAAAVANGNVQLACLRARMNPGHQAEVANLQ